MAEKSGIRFGMDGVMGDVKLQVPSTKQQKNTKPPSSKQRAIHFTIGEITRA
jgi:hypothetical protein